jgi:hypothetical protein
MSFPVWCELVCSQCARVDCGRWSHSSKIDREKMKSDALAGGWRLVRLENQPPDWICKRCVGARK